MIAHHDPNATARTSDAGINANARPAVPAASGMTFDKLAKLPVVRESEEAFQRMTGVALKLVPAGVPATRLSLGPHENPFCCLVSGTPEGAMACWKVEADAQRRVGLERTPQMARCFTGLNLVAVPVIVEGRHLATWLTGQVLEKKPTQRDATRVVLRLAEMKIPDHGRLIGAAYQRSPVATADQLEAMKRLLTLFATLLAEHARLAIMAPGEGEPSCVARAKEFVQAHLDERLNLKRIAVEVNLSPFHFTRIFRKTTGQTLWQYVSRLRVERAKAALVDPFTRVSEVAHASGFGSIPQFNAVFRRQIGMSPTEYRTSLRQRFSI